MEINAFLGDDDVVDGGSGGDRMTLQATVIKRTIGTLSACVPTAKWIAPWTLHNAAYGTIHKKECQKKIFFCLVVIEAASFVIRINN